MDLPGRLYHLTGYLLNLGMSTGAAITLINGSTTNSSKAINRKRMANPPLTGRMGAMRTDRYLMTMATSTAPAYLLRSKASNLQHPTRRRFRLRTGQTWGGCRGRADLHDSDRVTFAVWLNCVEANARTAPTTSSIRAISSSIATSAAIGSGPKTIPSLARPLASSLARLGGVACFQLLLRPRRPGFCWASSFIRCSSCC